MRQNLSYENELRLNENGKLFALTFVLKRWEWFNMGYREYRYHSCVHVFFEFWRKYLIIISSSSSDAHKIILEDAQRIALRVGACTVH